VPDAITSAAGPEQQALQGELSAQLHSLLEELSDKQRRILVLRVVVGLSAEETGEIVGATPGAVRLAQHRASTRMREIAVPGLEQADYSRSTAVGTTLPTVTAPRIHRRRGLSSGSGNATAG
jgi:DNA-directed RNA polymerase specialized sigma24 family protein